MVPETVTMMRDAVRKIEIVAAGGRWRSIRSAGCWQAVIGVAALAAAIVRP
jgi:hypothetical protein